MIYKILVELDIRSISEKNARSQVEELLFTTMKVDKELGLENWEIISIDWELINVQPKTTNCT